MGQEPCCKDPKQTAWSMCTLPLDSGKCHWCSPGNLWNLLFTKVFSIYYTFCTLPPPALGNTDVCIPQGFLMLKCLFSPLATLISRAQTQAGPRERFWYKVLISPSCTEQEPPNSSFPTSTLHSSSVLYTLKSEWSSKNKIWSCHMTNSPMTPL